MSKLCTKCFKEVRPEICWLRVRGVGIIEFSYCPLCINTFHSKKINPANTKETTTLQAKFDIKEGSPK